MVSVETILLLQQKVEGAVQKIERLKSENDALRAERSELTKALSEKSELLSRFSADEKKIEDGILGALNRLDSVENALLDANGGFAAQVQAAQDQDAKSQAEPAPLPEQKPESAPISGEEAQSKAALASADEQKQESGSASGAAEEPEIPSEQEADGGDDLFGDSSFETEEGDPDIF